MQFTPSEILRPFVQKYSAVTINDTIENEIFYPSGYIDLVVRCTGSAATAINGTLKTTPQLELLGHLTMPTMVSARKGTELLIARLHPYACSLFFKNPVSDFTNSATNIELVNNKEAKELYERICSASCLPKKIETLDHYLRDKLKESEKMYSRVVMLSRLCHYVTNQDETLSVKQISNHAGVSERTIQKQFLEHVGLQPISLRASHRFIKSLQQITSTTASLTTIALDCGYYDQAHFIKEFKRFTGISPLHARKALTRNDTANKIAVNVGL
ncbi:MAG TPA: helix-turn-helix transcriptional regulator [Cyclobacteriaceae bacterium]|nr:helix-turn-helix transcriptional regulator [Cyclobacteriaceae bacterium]